jgi:hypothetical protein
MRQIGGLRFWDTSRAEFNSLLTTRELEELAANPSMTVLQCGEPVDARVWRLLNEYFFSKRPDVELRIYGHYSAECDLAFAGQMTNVRHFAADCLMQAKNIAAIADIPNLESLSLGVFELEDFGVLELLSPTLTKLSLGATRSRKPSLSPLNRFRSLRVLYLEGHSKNIEVLKTLQQLEDITLRSITIRDLSYLSHLNNLWSLDIKLGTIQRFDGIDEKKSIKHLELWQVRGLRSVDILANLPGLQNLFLQSLPHITSLPSLRDLSSLRRIRLENLKGLHNFDVFETAPALEEFALIDGTKQMPEELLPVLRNKSVRRINGYFGSERKNLHFAHLREEHGKAEWNVWEPFQYR